MEGHARFHVALQDVVLEHELQLDEIGAVVDAGQLGRPVGIPRLGHEDGRMALGGRNLDKTGQIQLAGRCRGRDALEGVAQPGHVKRVQAGVDQPDVALVLGRVLELDDALQAVVVADQHPAVLSGIIELDRGH